MRSLSRLRHHAPPDGSFMRLVAGAQTSPQCLQWFSSLHSPISLSSSLTVKPRSPSGAHPALLTIDLGRTARRGYAQPTEDSSSLATQEARLMGLEYQVVSICRRKPKNRWVTEEANLTSSCVSLVRANHVTTSLACHWSEKIMWSHPLQVIGQSKSCGHSWLQREPGSCAYWGSKAGETVFVSSPKDRHQEGVILT